MNGVSSSIVNRLTGVFLVSIIKSSSWFSSAISGGPKFRDFHAVFGKFWQNRIPLLQGILDLSQAISCLPCEDKIAMWEYFDLTWIRKSHRVIYTGGFKVSSSIDFGYPLDSGNSKISHVVANQLICLSVTSITFMCQYVNTKCSVRLPAWVCVKYVGSSYKGISWLLDFRSSIQSSQHNDSFLKKLHNNIYWSTKHLNKLQ